MKRGSCSDLVHVSISVDSCSAAPDIGFTVNVFAQTSISEYSGKCGSRKITLV